MSSKPEQRETAIRVRELGKHYPLYGSAGEKFRRLVWPFGGAAVSVHRALSGVSFDVQRGECLGIIGGNGSGKSTLLKILAEVVQPTTGSVAVNGSVSALLELGAGFNPELTGRENVLHLGAVMGFSREEMVEKLPAVAEFAGLGAFLEKPVKVYSSGMFVRLAFALATAVDPEILLVDEALAVGDLRFQQKCLRRLSSFIDSGRTVVLVSHDTAQLKAVCTSFLWLKDGEILRHGTEESIIKDYVAYMTYDTLPSERGEQGGALAASGGGGETERDERFTPLGDCSSFGDGRAVVTHGFIADESGTPVKLIARPERLTIGLRVTASQGVSRPVVGFTIHDRRQNFIAAQNTYLLGEELAPLLPGETREAVFSFPFPPLANGHYLVSLAIADGTQEEHVQVHWVHDAMLFQVHDRGSVYHTSFLALDDCTVELRTRT